MGLHLGLPEASRRAFWARLYARRRLLSDLAAPFAPMHYALVGESLGYRPNAFFDPAAFRARANIAKSASQGLLESYLARPEPNAPSPSAEFDHGWYVSQNPDWAQTHPHPFLHFLERGLRAGRRPRPDIDVEFVRDITRGVKPRSLEEAAFRVFDRTLSEGEMGPPLNRQELRARQDRFYADGRLRIEREAGHLDRNVLVFVQCGPGFDAAYLEEPRSYDLLLNYYREASVHPKADIAVVQAGTKTTAIRRLMELRPDLLLRYQSESKAVAIRIKRTRATMVARLELAYAPELSTLSEPERCRRLVALDILTDFESWGRLRESHGLSIEEARALWINAIRRLLPAIGPDPPRSPPSTYA